MNQGKGLKRERIAIFGGSFDPVHKGHLEAAMIAVEELKLDRLIFVPAAINPFKLDKQPILGRHRLRMLELSIASDVFEICDFEIKRKSISYTIDTLIHHRKRFKDAELFLLIGSDNLVNFSDWKEHDKILKEARLVIFARDEIVDLDLIKRYNCILLKQKIGCFSSTKVKKGSLWHCTDNVREYISKNHLYLKDIAKNTLGEYRFNHCLKTANIARELAIKFGLCRRLSYVAGLTHDLTKEWSIEKHEKFLRLHGKDPKSLSKYQYHQESAAIWLRDVYRLKSPSVIRAVSVHTSLARELSKLDKIVFIADKISKFTDLEIRECMEMRIDELFLKIIKVNMQDLKDKGIILTGEQEEIYSSLLNGKK